MKLPDKNVLQTLIFIAVVVGGVLTGLKYFATADDIKFVEKLVVQNTQADVNYRNAQRYKELQSIKWKFDAEFGPNCQRCSPATRDEYVRILQEIDMLKTKLRIK